MKIERPGQKVTVSGQIGNSQTFGLASSGLAFKILSDGLYNDKIRAVIRELSCNAWDAHVMAGKRNVPFEIHLPTKFEPFFSIKDFGTGLDPNARYLYQLQTDSKGRKHEVCLGKEGTIKDVPADAYVVEEDDVIHLYCSYFSSDKNDNNEVIGAMGLGSKSPFCYCEGFTIVNRWNGTTRIYSSYINEQSQPEAVLQDVSETPGVPNGMEITFPVNEADCWEFENKAQLALEFFEPRPIINTGIKVAQQTYSLRTDFWGLRTSDEGGGLCAIQGNVQYNVGRIDVSRLDKNQQAVAELPLDLFFPIGELSVAASRETLQLNPRTIKNIKAMLDKVRGTFLDEIKARIAKCSAPWEARILLYSWGNMPNLGKIVREAEESGALLGDYPNFKLTDQVVKLNELDFEKSNFIRWERNWRAHKYASKQTIFSSRPDRRADILNKIGLGDIEVPELDKVISDRGGCAFLINDLKPGFEKYIHYFLQEADDNRDITNEQGIKISRIKTLYVFSRSTKEVKPEEVVAEALSIMPKLGNPPVMFLSQLKEKYEPNFPVVVKKPVVVRDILEMVSGVVRCWSDGYQIKGWSKMWTKSNSQVAGRKFYIPVTNLGSEEFVNAEKLSEFILAAKRSGRFPALNDAPIYGLKKDSKLRANKKEWVEVIPYIFSQIKKVMTPKLEASLSLLENEFENEEWDEILTKIHKNSILTSNSPIQMFADELAAARVPESAEEKLTALNEVLSVAEQRKLWEYKHTVNFNDKFKEVLEIYPMIKIINLSSWEYRSMNNAEALLLEYIKTVDQANQNKAVQQAAAGQN